MKKPKQVWARLFAEEDACKRDPTLLENDFVQGYMEALRFVLEDSRK